MFNTQGHPALVSPFRLQPELHPCRPVPAAPHSTAPAQAVRREPGLLAGEPWTAGLLHITGACPQRGAPGTTVCPLVGITQGIPAGVAAGPKELRAPGWHEGCGGQCRQRLRVLPLGSPVFPQGALLAGESVHRVWTENSSHT